MTKEEALKYRAEYDTNGIVVLVDSDLSGKKYYTVWDSVNLHDVYGGTHSDKAIRAALERAEDGITESELGKLIDSMEERSKEVL